MNPILEAARLQGAATITRKAWATNGKQKVHLWELSTGGVILLRHAEGEGFKKPLKLEEPLELIVNRFREKRGQRVFAPQAI